MDWSSVFDEVVLQPPASSLVLGELVASLRAPLSTLEIEGIAACQSNPFVVGHALHAAYRPLDPRGWRLPAGPLPAGYRELLGWSNGPWTRRGQRELGFFSAAELRSYTLDYHFPHYLPDVLPIALDGGGIFAALDMRRGAAADYPVLAVSASAIDVEEAACVGSSFEELVMGTTSLAEVLHPTDPAAVAAARLVDVVLAASPTSVAALMELRKVFAPSMSLGEFRERAKMLPLLLQAAIPHAVFVHRRGELSTAAAACIDAAEPVDSG